MSDIKVKVNNDPIIKGRLGDQNTLKVVSSLYSSNFVETLNDLNDVSLTSPIVDGSVLVYNSSISKWRNYDEIDGGTY